MAEIANLLGSQATIEDMAKDSDTLVQLIESCLFMRGEAVSAADIAENLGIPRETIDQGLSQLVQRYECFGGAIRVRQIDDDYWIMDLKEDVSEHVETFYIEQKPYTKSDIMTIAFIAYMQPVPRRVLAFYRGSSATAQARKWVDAGFVVETKVSREDPSLTRLMQKYTDEREEAVASASPDESNEPEGKKEHSKRDSWLDKDEFSCYVTAPRFSGYFNLPRDVDAMKAELENQKEMYCLFD
ncbi:MAG TPA: SMC-Scp complex subunit ScpB [Candidatus Lokiarchaeia archaeon]|nr:SMC-Scp complex subunit ScpB [Candidatus Lokiarchaeia archaeon]